eukprot:5594343-Pyramimonas_sp.AAC.1
MSGRGGAEMSLGILHGLCVHAKAGRETVEGAVERSSRLEGASKRLLRDIMTDKDWTFRKACVCGR